MKYYFLSILGTCFLFACSSVKMDTPETATKLVEFSKSPCYGRCPAYNLTIMTDGSMEYIGKRNVTRKGPYSKQLDTETYKALYTALKKENMYQYDDIYDKKMQDGSKTRIIYYGDKGKKAFGTMFTFPGNTQEIAKIMEEVATNENGWTAIQETMEDKPLKEDEPYRKLMSYNQGACFGQCPSFSIDIFTDGRMIYVGKSYAKLTGIHEKKIGPKELQQIIDLVSSEEFKTVNTREDERIMDAQTFKMTYFETISSKTEVKWKINDAAVLKSIKDYFNYQAESKGWKAKKEKDGVNPAELENTLIISLDPSVKPKDWILTQRHLEAKIVKFLSPNMTYFLISFNPELDKNRVAEELRRNKNVLNVQSGNRPAKPRGGTPKTGTSGKKGTTTIRGGNGG